MTTEQEHLVTMLFIKYGGHEAVVDAWLYSDEKLTATEKAAIEAWLDTEQSKPNKLSLVQDTLYPYLTVEIDLDTPDND